MSKISTTSRADDLSPEEVETLAKAVPLIRDRFDAVFTWVREEPRWAEDAEPLVMTALLRSIAGQIVQFAHFRIDPANGHEVEVRIEDALSALDTIADNLQRLVRVELNAAIKEGKRVVFTTVMQDLPIPEDIPQEGEG